MSNRAEKRESHSHGTDKKDAIPHNSDLTEMDDDTTKEIEAIMGFASFSSTKGKQVPGNNIGAVDKRKKLQARQMLHKRKLYELPLTKQDMKEKDQPSENLQL